MLHIEKITNLIIKRTPLLCGLLFAAELALLPVSAGAQCTNWDASGERTIVQRGITWPIYFKLEQNGRVLSGKATNDAKTGRAGVFYGRYDAQSKQVGTVDGTIDGDSFSIQIFWPGGLTGVYNAKVLPSGRLDGETYDKNNTKIRQPWHSEELLKCLPPPVQPAVIPAPPTPAPLKRTGHLPKSTPAPPPMKVPGIVAGPTIFSTLGAPTGLVGLSWDGGPDHPYAEVWVKVNNGDETFVVEQGKGGRQVTVQRGTLYEYILTDGGTTLATVRFLAN